jgi:hypothetical protein
MPSAFVDHVQSNPARSVSECLDDTLPVAVRKIEIPEGYYDLDEGYESARKHNPDFPPERPPVSFDIMRRHGANSAQQHTYSTTSE